MKWKNKIQLAVTFALVIMVSLMFSGCEKFLSTDRQGQYSPDDYPYPGGSGPYDQFIFGAYNQLRDYNLHTQFFTCVNFRSDDADKGSTTSDGGANAQQFDNFPVLPSNGYLNPFWLAHYTLINACNTTIKEVNTNPNIVASDDIKKQTIAEARFLRGYAYFNLVNYFGRVPLFDTLFSDPAAQNNVPQSTTAALWQFVENDLTFAAANLPLTWDSKTFPGRVTSGSANGLLAKAYLYQGKWTQAMAAANTVISSGVYNLNTSYDKIFREDGENSSESVFEIQATATNTVPTGNGFEYARTQGMRGSGTWDLGWGWNTPSLDLEAAYEPNDPRKARTFLYLSRKGQNGQADTIFTTIYGEVTPFWSRDPNSGTYPNRQYNNKLYTNPSIRASVGNRFGWWMNIRMLRYADVVLMYAEAANELGNTTEALQKLEWIRARARTGAPAGTLPQVTTTDQNLLRDVIRHERRIELAMEDCGRFLDLVRWGVSQSVMNGVGKTNFNASRDNLLPIPQTQIDLSQGVLTQNPGY